MSDLHICPKCDGAGHVKNSAEQTFLGIFTFGMAPMIDAIVNPDIEDSMFARQCRRCNGTGFIRQDHPTNG